ncbi:nine-cis-epoxycarotenoid dioxygenase 4 [Perilla frutescens var. hirtella]|uniref:Nine-cis-epoxycarotenoid dioxygenase 4 n=1 Tax=Perilla frutescens var. hirtella TaxID=608512 RepID=A0AAD4P356_PERFH|nr:nine-cis-epoxycarotenoid dioxygenase 4 [Perilla frutescens var. hirtella]
MESTLISSSFIPCHHELLHLSSSKRSNYVKIHHESTITISKSSIITTTFNPIKKLINHTVQTFQNLKNPSPSINNLHQQPLLPIIFNKIDDFIINFIDSPTLHPSINPKHVLSGHSAPVDELPPTACAVVEGALPPCLDGAYIRNGPNPQFIPKSPYHFFEGDGMLHVIRISQGKATFCCRYVKTHKHAVEREIGRPFVPRVLSSFSGGIGASAARLLLTSARVLAGQFDPAAHGFGGANATVYLFGGRLLAFCETDLPYAVKITPEGDIATLGRHDFQTSEPFVRMTAHPKIDRATGEAFAYEYDVVRPFLTFFRIGADGRKQKGVPISSMEACSCTHDFSVTENYAVFPDIQVVVNPWWFAGGRSPVGIDIGKVPRVGVIPKYAEDEREMRWIDSPGLNMMHCVNAWEEDGGAAITIVASNGISVDKFLDNFHLAQMSLEKITIDVEAKTVRRRRLSTKSLDLAVINPAYAAKKVRYVYATILGETSWEGVVKLDLSLPDEDGSGCTVASRLYGPGCCGGEPFFVARDPKDPTAAEDDGYLVTYVHDENIQESKFLVMDAKSPNLDIIAAVKLPQRIPDGFHGLFVSEADLSKL